MIELNILEQMAIDDAGAIVQKIDDVMDLYPGLFQWCGSQLYFVDKRITHLPMDLKLYRGFGKGGKVLNISWEGKYNRSNYIKLLENKQSGTIELISIHHTIPDESCVPLFDLGIEIIVRVNDFGTFVKYNEAEIKRRNTIENIIKHV